MKNKNLMGFISITLLMFSTNSMADETLKC